MLKLSYTIPHTKHRLFNIIKSNSLLIVVLRDHVPRKRTKMFLVLKEDNRKRNRRRRENEQEVIYRRRNPLRDVRTSVNSITHKS